MNSVEEKLGYLIAKAEEQGGDLKKLTERFDTLETEVQAKFKTAETTLRVFKWLGGSVFAVLTLDWQAIKATLSRWFS